jgi:hypothetical protein
MEASAKSKAVTAPEQPAAPAAVEEPLEQKLLAVATTPQERSLAFQLAGAERQQKMLRLTAQAVAEEGWGKAISPVARQAVVRYCLEIGADPIRHVHVLAGTVYLNAAFWMELVAANPKFRRPEEEFIHHDERASDKENEERKAARVQFGVPEGVKGAAVVTLHYEGRGPFVGVNWVGARKNPDPVGEAEPTKTALTRAYRKAAIKAEPAWFTRHPRLQSAQEVFADSRVIAHPGEPGESVAPPQLPEGRQPTTTVKHVASAICAIEGEHPADQCAYETKAP